MNGWTAPSSLYVKKQAVIEETERNQQPWIMPCPPQNTSSPVDLRQPILLVSVHEIVARPY